MNERVSGAGVRFGKQEHWVEYLTPDSPATYVGWPYRVTDEALAIWALDGVWRTNRVDLRGVVPEGVSGTLVFTFQRDTVKASWRNDPGGD